MNQDKVEMRVAAKSNAHSLAGAIVKTYEERHDVSLLSVGAGSVNQAVKGIIIARSILASQGRDVFIRPGFKDVEIDSVKKSAIILDIIIK